MGLYPDAPSRRVAWDRDGSVLTAMTYDATAFAGILSAATRQALNDESENTSGFASGFFSAGASWAVLFPVAYTIVGWYLGFGKLASPASDLRGKEPYLQWSPNTTNGIDGTWTTLANLSSAGGAVQFDNPLKMRQNIVQTGGPLVSARGMRFGMRDLSAFGSCLCTSWHMFGTRADTTRLAIWDGAVNQEHPGPYFDFAEVTRGLTYTKTFRVKNLSALTANGVVVSLETLTPQVPDVLAQLRFTTDGVNYFSSINIGNLAPGALSAVITLRYIVDPAAALSLGWQRILAIASSFS